MQERLWDDQAKSFKVRLENGSLSNAREEIEFILWMFNLPESGKGCEAAWAQLTDPQDFRSHGVGTCEWDGVVWPFADASASLGDDIHASG